MSFCQGLRFNLLFGLKVVILKTSVWVDLVFNGVKSKCSLIPQLTLFEQPLCRKCNRGATAPGVFHSAGQSTVIYLAKVFSCSCLFLYFFKT